MYPVAIAVCIGLRVRHRQTRFTEALCPRRCPPPHLGSPTGPSLWRGYSVRGVLGTTARSARLAPTDRLRLVAYTVRLAVRGRSRRRASPSQFCVVRLVAVPLPVRRRGLRVRLPVSSPVIPAFAILSPARPPVLFPTPTSVRGPLRRGSIRLALWPGDSFAPLGETHPLGRRRTCPSELSLGRSPKPDGRLTTRSDGLSARPISHRLVHGFVPAGMRAVDHPCGCRIGACSICATPKIGQNPPALDRWVSWIPCRR